MKVNQKLAITYLKTKLKLLSIISIKKAAEKAFEIFCTPQTKSIVKTSVITDAAERLNFTLNNLNVQGYRWNKDKPYKILIMHGFRSSAQNFNYYVAAFKNKGYQIIAFDAPAHGNSEGSTINAVLYSQMIEKVIKLFGPFNGYLAHSLGGLAWSLALEHIDCDEKTKAVLIAPATETTSAIDEAFKLLQINDMAVRQAFNNLIEEMGGHPPSWYSIRRAVNNIKASILWIHDEEDDITPLKDALAVKEDGHENITFKITNGLGHRKIYRDPVIQKEVIKFLSPA